MTLRPPGEEDVPAIVAMRSRCAPEPFTEERLHREWGEPGFERERDARVSGGGYAAVEHLDDHRTWIELHGERPEPLLAWALSRATGSRVLSGAWEGNEPVQRALEAAGFGPVRHSYRMAIELDDVPPAALLPAGLELRTFRPGEERAVYETEMETFEDSWEHVHVPYERWLHWTVERPGFDPGLWLLAVEGEAIAGIALCRIHEEDPATGWVTILGVRRAWRRRGLGEALLRAGFAELARRGCARAVLGVDAESLTGAHRVYERAGMRAAARFEVYER